MCTFDMLRCVHASLPCKVTWENAARVQAELQSFMASADTPASHSEQMQKLWDRVVSGEERISHDGYLKQLQLTLARGGTQLLPVFQPYDVLVIDEAQDCTAAMLDIVYRIPQRAKILAFDYHQNISHFRGVKNNEALIAIPAQYTPSLPRSLRFGPKVAELLTDFIRTHKEESGFQIHGNPAKATDVSHVSGPDEAYKSALKKGRLTVVARKNSTLLSEVEAIIAALARRSESSHEEGYENHTGRSLVRQVLFVGGWKSYKEQVLQPVMDLHYLDSSEGGSSEHNQILNPFVRRFANLQAFRFVVRKQEMVDWMAKLEIYDSVDDFPKFLHQIEDLVTEDEADANVFLSTVHKSKGLGWPSVLLLDDFLSVRGGAGIEEELNICYVALSRVSTGTLYLTFDPKNRVSPRTCGQKRMRRGYMSDAEVSDDGLDLY